MSRAAKNLESDRSERHDRLRVETLQNCTLSLAGLSKCKIAKQQDLSQPKQPAAPTRPYSRHILSELAMRAKLFKPRHLRATALDLTHFNYNYTT